MRLTLRETLLAFTRAPLLSALGVITIAFSLFAVGLFGLVALNIRQALARVEQRVEIRAYIVDGTPVETVAAAVGDVGAFPEVALVRMVSADEALARARREMPEFKDVFDASFLPASMEIQLRPGFRDPTTVKAVADRLRSYQFVDDVRYGQEWVEKLYRIRNLAGIAGIGLGLTFAAVAIIIIGATIRMSVLAREREIVIMRLVGATDSFVRRPFLLDGFLKGILGGILALALVWAASVGIRGALFRITFFDARLMLSGVAFGALVGFLGSALSVRRQLRRV